ncbi:UvrD-helicase domain-containing protein [Xinfangfangia sp. CPCC 101601]|uniref:DNA 3'-5' helicase n=2 Tax=Pseudogemmobacter lacusdianii TaxID=3069608 RepID=A0ABU0VVM5_9RHOB|nr:UvrD-helicase domain-containing protein [Xinfangfangia sp. CPCC 101601]MDQ2065010.1 UvrD-helicase domain-containing protein [Xinfangfangia sp. CPCC 101601]
MAARPAPYLDDLNPAQRAAVEAMDGPVLMLAGAGTGKTKALTTRIVHILNTQRARPNEILAVTFTNKAAREMKERVFRLLGPVAEGMPWMGTFHSLSVKILRRHAELVGLKPSFTILDTDDQLRLLKQLIQARNIDDKRWPPRMLAGLIDAWKNRALTPARVPVTDASAYNNLGTEIYAEYQARLRSLNACDFGDLLLHCVEIFKNHPDVLAQYQRWFRYILVDEYQDTNVAQYLWLRLLAQAHQNICCVGDDDQSIYGWRGAEVGNILKFEKDFPGATVIRLEQNYRSTPHILAAASAVIAGNAGRLGKTLWTEAEDGEKVRLIGHWDGEEEARWIGEEVEALRSGRHVAAKNRLNLRSMLAHNNLLRIALGGLKWATRRAFFKAVIEEKIAYSDERVEKLVKWLLTKQAEASAKYQQVLASPLDRFSLDEIAILVRASYQMRAFEDRFLTIGLPYRVIGGPRFYERQEIRDAMAYFRLAVSPEDDLAFERVVNLPKRGLGDKAQQEIQLEARAIGMSLHEGARSLLARKGLSAKAASQLKVFVEGIDLWHNLIVNRDNPQEIAKFQARIASHYELMSQLSAELSEFEVLEGGEVAFDLLIEDPKSANSAGQSEQIKQQLIRIQSLLDVDKNFLAILEGDHIRLAEMILDESGYMDMWQKDKNPEAPGRVENLKELVKGLEHHENLQGFLDHVSLIMDNDAEESVEKVSIMTLHGAKGLEFPVVFLPGWEDGLFPSQRSMDESGQKGIEEERRLAYVGITRAEELCTISFASNRRVYGQWQSQLPSRFIDELPSAHVDVITPPSLMGGGYGAAAGFGGFGSHLEERVSKADVYNSPGWKRLQERQSSRPIAQPREARNMTIDAAAISGYSIGDRVFHTKFGYGEVVDIEGDKLDVRFDKAGEKKIVARFVMPADQADDMPF